MARGKHRWGECFSVTLSPEMLPFTRNCVCHGHELAQDRDWAHTAAAPTLCLKQPVLLPPHLFRLLHCCCHEDAIKIRRWVNSSGQQENILEMLQRTANTHFPYAHIGYANLKMLGQKYFVHIFVGSSFWVGVSLQWQYQNFAKYY